MASKARSVWAIDIGNNSLKALNLALVEGKVEVLGFETIEHEIILSSADISEEQHEQIIASSLEKLTSKYDLHNEEIAISVAGQSSFARFIKLPPVEPKKIPQIIKFEAVQQIPFDINEVEWDYQLMDTPESPEVSVGIFAIKNEIISKILDNYTRENLRVGCVQMAPISLYNFAHYDSEGFKGAEKKATIVLDMGTDNTNLVICSANSVWQRCIPMGGNDFTMAIAEAFKLDFKKAEKLKRSAPVSKYARQIFQAMKPVFTSLSEEIQRSLGYFSSSNDVEFSKVIALGGGTKLQGLSKYIQQSVGVPVVRPDSFKRVNVGENVSSAKFHESIADFGIVYGLGVQALDVAKIESNLLPRKIARTMSWQQKSKFFIAAVSLLLLVSLLCVFRAFKDKATVSASSSVRRQIQSVLSKAKNASSELSEQEGMEEPLNMQIEEDFALFKYRNVIPIFTEGILSCLPNAENNPSQAELYKAFNEGDTDAVKAVDRSERKQLFITAFRVDYAESVDAAAFGETKTYERKSTTSGAAPGGFGGGMPSGFGGRMPGGFGGGMPASSKTARGERQATAEQETEQQDGKGFLVIIEGYSPYKEIGELLDPAGVGDDQTRWGFITRLMNFNKIFKKSDFELYKKNSVSHFSFETGEVDIKSDDMPAGVGREIVKVRVEVKDEVGGRSSSKAADNVVLEEAVLIDPMTGEEISKTFKIDDTGLKQFNEFGEEEYIVRDYWFKIKAKFLWKDETAGTYVR